jgi:sulfonate transport system permease protein
MTLRNPKFWRGLVVPVSLLALWYLATAYKWVNPLLLAQPHKVITRAISEYSENDLVGQLLASLRRDLFGFVLGSSAGLLVGGAMGMSRLAERLFGPSFNAAKQVALFAWLPLLSVWCGTGETAKVVFVALSAFYPVVLNTCEGFGSVSRDYLEVARVFRFTRGQVIRRVMLPAAAPSIFAGMHLALIYAWLGTLGAEYLLSAAPGIGNLMTDGREQFAMDKVMLGIIIVGAVGASINALAESIEAHALRWRVRST